MSEAELTRRERKIFELEEEGTRQSAYLALVQEKLSLTFGLVDEMEHQFRVRRSIH